MKYNPALHNRHSIRLRGYDYATFGAYFVTICLNRRIPHIVRGQPDAAMGQPRQPQGQTRQPQGQPRGVAPTMDFPILGSVENGVMMLNDSGKMIQQIWNEMPIYYSGVELGEFIVMPDHIHGIIKINNSPVGATPRGCPIVKRGSPTPMSLPYLMNCFKTMTTAKYIDGIKTAKWKPFRKKLWQRNYYERIIRDEAEYARIAKYIRNNPILWEKKH